LRKSGLRHLLKRRRQHGVRGIGFGESRYQHRRQDRRFDSFVVIRVDANVFVFGGKGKFAAFQRLQLVMRLKIRPAPNAAIDDVRKSFTMRHLQTAVQRPRNGHAFRRMTGTRQSAFQFFQSPFGLLQLLDERVDGFFRPTLLLISLLPTEETFDGRRSEAE